MSTTTDKSVADAGKALAHYLSDVFHVNFYFPGDLGEGHGIKPEDEDQSFSYFISLLPLVRQKSVSGKTSDFFLPLVAKPITFPPHIGVVINAMLADGQYTPFEVPTFFYPDGSTMVVSFDPAALSQAIAILSVHPEYLDCLCPAKKGGT